MVKQINAVLTGIPATLIGGVFLICSFIFPKMGIVLPLDPPC